jgi:hypothetical protein
MIPLSEAMLCIDCEVVFNPRLARACPGCGSAEYSPIGTFLKARDAQAFEAAVTRELYQLRALPASPHNHRRTA